MKGQRVQNEIRENLKINKTCSCGKVHTQLPVETVVEMGRYWFNCGCQSTLVIKTVDAQAQNDTFQIAFTQYSFSKKVA